MTNELLIHLKKYAKHFSNLCNVDCNIFNVNPKEMIGDSFCEKCDGCDFANTHKYGCFEAQRWNRRYIYYCPAGFIFIAVVIIDSFERIDAGVLAGPIIMGNIEDFESNLYAANIPNIKTSLVNDMAEIMASVFITNEITETFELEDLLNDIYKTKENLDECISYPIDLEKELQLSISQGNAKLSKELLNKLLGQIFFCSYGDFKTIKSRVVELIVLLSRSAIEGGADLDKIFLLNENYIDEIKAFKTVEQLSIWLSGIISRFVSYVFEFNDVKHADILFKVINYIKNNYKEKLTLEDIADYVYLSKSYLSKIFKDGMECTITNYINNVRIEKSKELFSDSSLSLTDIAYMVGFEDQSYYTKVFKGITGVTPGKYKNSRGKKEILK